MRAYIIRRVSASAAAAALAIVGLTGARAAPGATSPAPAPSGGPQIAYVVSLDANTVTPINTATNQAGPPIKVGTNPNAIAITPNGKTAYVTNSGSASVTPISTATDKAGRSGSAACPSTSSSPRTAGPPT